MNDCDCHTPVQTAHHPSTSAQREGEPVILLRNVSMRYDSGYTLRDVNLTLRKGDFLAISGPNGGGKTTLLRLMLRLLKPTSGKVIYAGRPSIGYLPQKSIIDTHFPITVEETVKSGLAAGSFGRLPVDASIRLKEVIELCGIGGFLHHHIDALSGGQLQRTLLARAIAGRPQVLVLDEPLSYVDKQFERQIYNIMEELASKVTIVLVSHEMSVISGMATRHIIVDHKVTECHAAHHGVLTDCR